MFGVGHVGRQMPAHGAVVVGPPNFVADFMTPNILDPSITFARASTATYFDATGHMLTAATNVARWDCDPVTHVLNGILVEETKNNLLWDTKFVPVGATITPNAGLSPMNTNSMQRVTEDNSVGFHYVSANVAVTAAAVNTFSVFAKAAEVRYVQLFCDNDSSAEGCFVMYDLQTGVISQPVVAIGTGVVGIAFIQDVGGGLYRLSMSATGATNGTMRCGIVLSRSATSSFPATYSGNGTSGLTYWGSQHEVWGYATSYIPTTVSAVVRASESMQQTLGGWYNAPASSLLVEYILAQSPNPYVSGREAVSINDGTSSNRLLLRGQVAAPGTNGLVANCVAGASAITGSIGVIVPNSVTKLAGSWDGVMMAGAMGGGSPVFAPGGIPSVLNVISYGNRYTNNPPFFINGWMRKVSYWPSALSGAQLQTVTK